MKFGVQIITMCAYYKFQNYFLSITYIPQKNVLYSFNILFLVAKNKKVAKIKTDLNKKVIQLYSSLN